MSNSGGTTGVEFAMGSELGRGASGTARLGSALAGGGSCPELRAELTI